MSRHSLLALALIVGTVSCQNFGSSNMFHQSGFGGPGMSSFGGPGMTSFGGTSHGLNTLAPVPRSAFGPRSTGSRTMSSATGVRNTDPPEIRRLLGSTVHGRPLRFGELGLPRHGGAGQGPAHANGMLRGWDGNPQTLGNQFQDTWRDPFRGGPVPPMFFGGGFGMGGRPHFM